MPTIGPRVNKEARGCASYGLDGNAAGAKSYKRYGFHGDIPAGFIFARAKAREFALHPKPAKSLVNPEFEALKENALLQIPELDGRKARTLEFKAAREALRINVGELPEGVYTIMPGNAARKPTAG